MSSGPENRFIRSIHRLLPATVYAEKMHNPYRGGTFDVWYSGKLKDTWIEYKWIARIPRSDKIIPDLSELQKKWGRGRYEEGRTVKVVVGCPQGAVVFATPDQWEGGKEQCSTRLLTKLELAQLIAHSVAGEPLDANSTNNTSGRGSRRVRVQDPDHRVPDIRARQVPPQQEKG